MKLSALAGLLALLLAPCSLAQTKHPQRLVVGQGISSPDRSTPVSFANGFTFQNPAGASLVLRPQLVVAGDYGEVNKGVGGEIGLGNGAFGLGGGYYKDCAEQGCGRAGAIAAIGGNAVAVGLGYHEKATYSAGVLFSPKGPHRFGVVADSAGANVNAAKTTSIGAGYSFVKDDKAFVLDVSRRARGGTSVTKLTPGLYGGSANFQVSLNYNIHLGDDRASFRNGFWFGLGLVQDNFLLAGYKDLKNDWAAQLTWTP